MLAPCRCTETGGSPVQPRQDPGLEPSGVRAELLRRALEKKEAEGLSEPLGRMERGCWMRDGLLRLPCGGGRGKTCPRRAGMGLRWRRRSLRSGAGRRWKPPLLALRRDDRWWMSEGEKQTAGARGRGAYCILNEPVCHGSWHPRHMEPNTAALLDVSK